ncbi:MAG: zinc ribbon domain-containing protein [Ignavibacteriales bacterium]|nr:zinc ribbon domain-containing protein [Ignavibacteriales bacterium]
MPTYHYKCKSCKEEFEELQRISEDALVDCPFCGKPALARMMSGGAGLVFKGSGFYITDYKGKSPAGDKPKTESSSEKPAETKKETKPSVKSDSSSSGSSSTTEKK